MMDNIDCFLGWYRLTKTDEDAVVSSHRISNSSIYRSEFVDDFERRRDARGSHGHESAQTNERHTSRHQQRQSTCNSPSFDHSSHLTNHSSSSSRIRRSSDTGQTRSNTTAQSDSKARMRGRLLDHSRGTRRHGSDSTICTIRTPCSEGHDRKKRSSEKRTRRRRGESQQRAQSEPNLDEKKNKARGKDRYDFERRLENVKDPTVLKRVEAALDSITCPVCLEHYDPRSRSKNRIPCALRCGHSFCLSHGSQVSACPVCRADIFGRIRGDISGSIRGRSLQKSVALCEASKAVCSMIASTLDLDEERNKSKRRYKNSFPSCTG